MKETTTVKERLQAKSYMLTPKMLERCEAFKDYLTSRVDPSQPTIMAT